jgi:glycerate dehydrogenase
MKVVVFQGRPDVDYITRDEMVQEWKSSFQKLGITDYEIKNSFDPNRANEQIDQDVNAVVGVYVNGEIFSQEFFKNHPNLKYVATMAHGFGKIDPKTIEDGVTYTNTVYGNMTIAEYSMALLMETMHHIQKENDFYRHELDLGIPGFSTCTRQMELYGKTVGVIGIGSIGMCFAKMVSSFGTHVLGYSRHIKTEPEYDFIEQVSLDELLERSDIISIHTPLTDETRHMINEESIKKMKDGVILINTARGDIIEEDALYDALMSRKIYAAGLDVVSGEPRSTKSKIFDCRNAIITRHIAWLPREARIRAVQIASENVANWINGKPTSVIR